MSKGNDFALSWELSEAKGKAIITAQHDEEILHVDDISPNSATSRKRYSKAMADKGFDAGIVERELISIATEFSLCKVVEPTDAVRPTDLLNQMADNVVDDARDKLRSSNLFQLIVDDVHSLGVMGEACNILLLYLVGTSRLLDRPANAIVQGSSSSGKSYLIDKVSDLFPPEAKIVASSMTPQALHHMPPGTLRHKFVVAGERSRLENDDRAEATRALREMLASGKLSKLMPEKGPFGIETILIEQEGPIAFVESTTLNEIFDEDLNRCLLIHPDESPEQTKRILLGEARGKSSEGESTIQRHYAMQRLLSRVSVEIPYCEQLAQKLPTDRVETRRLFPMLLAVIRASALLNQFQRKDMGNSTICATENDYVAAYRLLRKPLSEALAGDVSDAVKTYFAWLRNADVPATFCVGDLLNCNDNPKAESQTYAIVKELHSANFLITVDEGHRKKHFKINEDPVRDDVLPSPAALFGSENRKIA